MGKIGDSPSEGAAGAGTATASAGAIGRQALVRASADTTQQTGIYAWRIKSSTLGPVEIGLESGGKELFRQAIVHRPNTFMILQREGGKGGDAFSFKLDPNRKATKVIGIQSEFMKTAAARLAVDLQRPSGDVTANFDMGSCIDELEKDFECANGIAQCESMGGKAKLLACVVTVMTCTSAIIHAGPCMNLFSCDGQNCTTAVGDNGVPIDDGADGGSSDDGTDAGSPDDTDNGDDQGSDECTPDPSCNPCISSCECAEPELTCTDTSGGSDGDESSGGGC